MRELNFEALQEIVKNDAKGRYSLVHEADPDGGEKTWWIRANQGHSMKVGNLPPIIEVHIPLTVAQSVVLDLQPINSHTDIPTGIAVHGTNKSAWEIISEFDTISAESTSHRVPTCTQGSKVSAR